MARVAVAPGRDAHAALVAASFVLWPMAIRLLWLTPRAGWPPVAWVVCVAISIGLPSPLSATSPLLQVWCPRLRAPLNVSLCAARTPRAR